MHQIISFFLRYKVFLLFLVLQIIAISLTIQSHSYHRSKFINSSNAITGFIYEKFNIIGNLRNLKKNNHQLAQENTKLKNLLTLKSDTTTAQKIKVLDSLIYQQNYTYIKATITNNVYHKSNNFLNLNRGQKDGVLNDMGVINSKGIVGIVSNTSNSFASVMSILNENSKINARLKKSNHFGTLSWDGKDYKTIQFEDLPRQSNLKVGDTVITDGKSIIFPEGILIGKIKSFKSSNSNYNSVNIELFNDMSAIKHVNIVLNLDKIELQELNKNNE